MAGDLVAGVGSPRFLRPRFLRPKFLRPRFLRPNFGRKRRKPLLSAEISSWRNAAVPKSLSTPVSPTVPGPPRFPAPRLDRLDDDLVGNWDSTGSGQIPGLG